MPYALITGASGGIGLAIARELASRKHDVLLVARSGDKLSAAVDAIKKDFGVSASYLSLDLELPDAVAKVFAWVNQNGFEVSILINNAGYASWGTVKDVPNKEFLGMMQLNMVTLAGMCKTFMPHLERHKKSYILNIASTAAYQAVPTLTTYAATKAFVLLFTRGLSREMAGTPVSVSCLSPGPTSTGFIDRARLGIIKDRAEKFSMTPEAVAKTAVSGMLAGKMEIIPGFTNWLSSKLAEIVPKGIPEGIARNLYKV